MVKIMQQQARNFSNTKLSTKTTIYQNKSYIIVTAVECLIIYVRFIIIGWLLASGIKKIPWSIGRRRGSACLRSIPTQCVPTEDRIYKNSFLCSGSTVLTIRACRDLQDVQPLDCTNPNQPLKKKNLLASTKIHKKVIKRINKIATPRISSSQISS